MRRGMWRFVTSIIYSAAVIMVIYFVFHAFADAFTPVQSGDSQLSSIKKLIDAPGTSTVIQLEKGQSIFIGYPYADTSGACAARVKTIGGTCTDGSLCVCYSYTGKTNIITCRSMFPRSTPGIVHDPKNGVNLGGTEPTDSTRHYCAWTDGPGLYQVAYTYDNQNDRISIRRTSS